MNKKNVVAFMIMLFILTICGKCFALGFSPGDFKGAVSVMDGGVITNMSSAIFSAVRLAGSAVAGISLTILGIKYMTSSVEDKAEIKRRLIPFVIGTALFFGVTFVIEMIINMANWLPS